MSARKLARSTAKGGCDTHKFRDGIVLSGKRANKFTNNPTLLAMLSRKEFGGKKCTRAK
jgi:hypothetical protein